MSIVDQLEKRKKLLSFLNSPSREEIFTPVKLAEEMLDKLPKEVWSNPDLLWCDPCSKSGVFMLEVVIRLMKHLPIKDETLRYNHIINNMISVYVNVERNKWLVSKMVYGSTEQVGRVGLIDDINKINTEEMPKFDVVVGNPPYQGKKLGGGQGSGNLIWNGFVELSFNILKDNGYLCMIHPVQWRIDINRKKIATAQDLLFNNQMMYLRTSQTPFTGIATVVDWYVVKKTEKTKPTVIDADNGRYEKILKKEVLPNQGGPLVESIINKVFSEHTNELKARKGFGGLIIFDKTKPKGRYKFAHGMKSFSRNIFKYYEYPHIHQYNKKILIPDLGMKAYYDPGELGVGDHLHYIIVKNENEAKFIKKIIESNLMIFLQKIFSGDVWVGNSPKRWNNTYPMSKIKLSDKKIQSDKDLYNFYHLTQEEIDYIESQIK